MQVRRYGTQDKTLARLTEIITDHGGRIVSVCNKQGRNGEGGYIAAHHSDFNVFFEVKNDEMYKQINAATLAEWPR